jgi:hypothetical protein
MARRARIGAGAAAGLVVLLAIGSLAAATTGPTGLPQPKDVVRPAIGDRFTGRYVIATIDRRARIISGQLSIDYTSTKPPFLLGNLLLFHYDHAGRQSSFIANAYPWRYVPGELSAALSSQGAGETLGRLTFRLPTNATSQSGTIDVNGHPYAITYRRMGDDVDPDAAVAQAVQVDPPPAVPRRPGLGPRDADWYGTYTLQPASTDRGAGAGLYAPVVRLAARLDPDGAPTAGRLRLAGGAGGPVGRVTLLGAGGSTRSVSSLTRWRWAGDRRRATVRRGGPDGSVVGSFTGTARGDEIAGVLRVGARTTAVRFRRDK